MCPIAALKAAGDLCTICMMHWVPKALDASLVANRLKRSGSNTQATAPCWGSGVNPKESNNSFVPCAQIASENLHYLHFILFPPFNADADNTNANAIINNINNNNNNTARARTS